MSHGLGWLPDHHTGDDLDARDLVGTVRLADEVDIEPTCSPMRNQARTNSCLGFAIAGAIDAECGAHGVPFVDPSPQDVYTRSRRRSTRKGVRLVDLGAYVYDTAASLADMGICREADWPFDPARINDDVPLRVVQAAFPLRGLRGHYRIFGDEVEIARAALSAKRVPWGGWVVDRDFQVDAGPAVVTSLTSSAEAGGHAMCVVGFRKRAGRWEFKLRNSWGTPWRSGGYVWLDETPFRSVLDGRVLDMIP